MPWDYRRAQCLLRGLEGWGSVAEMQDVIVRSSEGDPNVVVADEAYRNNMSRKLDAGASQSTRKKGEYYGEPEDTVGPYLGRLYPLQQGGKSKKGEAMLWLLPRSRIPQLSKMLRFEFQDAGRRDRPGLFETV